MPPSPVSISRKFAEFDDHWAPKIVAQCNDMQFKVVKLLGDFVWHRHAEADEAFLVIEGSMRIDFRDGAVELAAGELLVVPRNVEHKPFAAMECRVLVLQLAGLANTGDASPSDLTAPGDVWI